VSHNPDTTNKREEAPATIGEVLAGLTFLLDIIYVALLLIVYYVEGAVGGREWLDYMLWKLLPVVALINAMCIASRLIERRNAREESNKRSY
jgi:hypothetical protein